jgi:hypothetical protein
VPVFLSVVDPTSTFRNPAEAERRLVRYLHDDTTIAFGPVESADGRFALWILRTRKPDYQEGRLKAGLFSVKRHATIDEAYSQVDLYLSPPA